MKREDLMELTKLFVKCISVPYMRTGVSADYAVLRDGDTLSLLFQDSDGFYDWKRNLDFPAKPYKRMGRTIWFAHRGFLKVWKEVEPMLSGYILDKSISSVIIAGYSHGAALALLCHEYVCYNRPELIGRIHGYGFGCPRCVWGFLSADARRRWESFTVIRNIDDIVTHLPPAFLGYRHVGKMLEIGEKKKYSAVEAHFKENILKELYRYEKTRE